MDTATNRRLVLGFISNWISRLAGTIIQLVQVPVFLTHWSTATYGEWLIVNSIPSYLSFSNIGFGSVAGNEMTMSMAREDKAGALSAFQSCWWLIVAVCSATIMIFAVALYTLPVARWLKLSAISAGDARWILFALGAAVLFGQLEQLLGAAYTCIGRYPYGTFIKSVLTLAAFFAMMVPVVMGRGPRAAAIVFASANVVGTIVLALMVRRDVPWIEFGWSHARRSEIRRMAAPAFAFMGFPLGNALNIQTTLLAVGYALGPVAVVVFGTARTVSRVALQMVQMINTTFWPELSTAFGAGNVALLRSLHRRAVQMAFIIAVVLIAVMMTIGPWFLTHWTAHKVPPSPKLLGLMLLSVFFYALWSTSSTLLAAINRHQTLALYYICGTAATVVVTYFAARYSGLLAAAASLVLSELVMNIYVLPASLRLSEDTWPGFLAAMFDYPQMLRPKNLLRRLRRTSQVAPEPGELEI
jgi:O-antigen/teichoic acid export membrane protein